MSKCKQCGNELVWVGSMWEGKLECPYCLAMEEMLSRDDSDLVDIISQGFDLDAVTSKKFSYTDHHRDLVQCPTCGWYAAVESVNAKNDSVVPRIQCPRCGIWAEVE